MWLYATTTKHFSIGLWCAMYSGFYMTTGDGQLGGWTEKKLQSTFQHQTCTKKWLWSLFGSLLSIWSTTAFWIPVETTSEKYDQQINEMHQNCNVCSWHWSTERAQFFCMTTLNHMSHNQCFKSWTDRAMKFCLICHVHLISCQPTIISSSILTTFCRENTSTYQQEAENTFQEFIESWSMDFYITGILAKSVDFNGSYFY